MGNKYEELDKEITKMVMEEFQNKIIDTVCSVCNGEGHYNDGGKCENCNGEGHYNIKY